MEANQSVHADSGYSTDSGWVSRLLETVQTESQQAQQLDDAFLAQHKAVIDKLADQVIPHTKR